VLIGVTTSSSTTVVHGNADVEARFEAVEGVESSIKSFFEDRISREL
jgi:hypothetical protein